MKRKTGNNIKLGVFVTLGTLLFITGIYFVGKKQNLFDRTFRISTTFRDVSGLQPGNNVRFGGINIGMIDNIAIVNDTAIQVDLQILEKVRRFIKEDSRAVIGSDGLMGNKILIITPGTSGKVVADNAFISAMAPVNMDDILQNLKVTIENAAVLTGDLSVIADNIKSGKGTIGKLMMDSTFAEDIDKTVVNIRKGTGGFQENMEAAKSNILFRGYFRKKEREAEKQAKEKQEAAKAKTSANTAAEKEKAPADTVKTSKRKRNR